MRKCWWAVAVFLLMACRLVVADEVRDHKLTVFGKVRVFAKADRATIRFDIKGVGNTLSAAFNSARIKLDSIATRLYEVGLQKTDLSTSFFRNEENFGDKAFLSSKKDFRAIMTVTIATKLLDSLESITVILSQGSIEQIQSIEFDLVDYNQLRKNALEQATNAAREKAEVVAKSLGVSCGSVVEFEELRVGAAEQGEQSFPQVVRARRERINPFNAPYYAYSLAEGDRAGGIIYAQDIEFDAEVRVIFEIVDENAAQSESSSKH